MIMPQARRNAGGIPTGGVTLLFVVFLFALAGSLPAQDEVTITAEVKNPVVLIGDSFLYRVTVERIGAGTPPGPTLPSFEPFTFLNVSQATNLVMGNTGRRMAVHTDVQLRATKAGTFTIPAATVEYEGKTLEAKPVQVVVSSNPKETAAAGVELKGGFVSARTSNATINEQLKGKLFLYTEMEKSHVVSYEPVLAKTYVYKAPGLVEGEEYGFVEQAPAVGADYLTLDIIRNAPRQWEPVDIGDVVYQRALVEAVALVPTKTGTVNYRASTVGARLPVQGNRRRAPGFDDPFGDPFASFFGRDQIVAELPPPPRQIVVEPLPQPQPEKFSGIVGDFDVQAQIDRPEVNQGEIVTLSLIFQGDGYAGAIPEPVLPAIEGFNLYDKRSEIENRPRMEGVFGRKVFEYLLRAEQPGTHTIPPWNFVTYNPESGRYVTLTTGAREVKVISREDEGPLVLVQSDAGSARAGEEVRTLGVDIAHIHTGNWTPTPGLTVPLYARPWWWGLQILPPALLLLTLYVRRRRQFFERNPELLRQGRAAGEAERRLKKARSLITLADSDKFYSEVASAIRKFLADKLGRESAGLTLDDIDQLLRERQVPDDLRQYALRLLEACDAARFALGADAPGTRQSLLDEVSSVLRRLREALR